MATAKIAAVGVAPVDKVLRGLIALLLAAFVWLLYDSLRERLVVVGDTAPDFSVSTDTGRLIKRSEFGGKLLVLNFWATWCPPCLDEIPSLDRFQQALASKGVVVLAISVDKDEKQYRDFLSRAKVSFLTARDPENKINAEYGTVKFPETYIIDARGQVVRKVIAARDWMDPAMLADIQSLL